MAHFPVLNEPVILLNYSQGQRANCDDCSMQKSVIGGYMVRLVVKLSSLINLFLLVGCVNQAGSSDPYRIFSVTEAQRAVAEKRSLPYVRNKRRVLQTIEPINYQTAQFGHVQLAAGFVSDGSSRPFDTNQASTLAALLHDALYRGAQQLRFMDGFKGEWTKQLADDAYCEQLVILGAPT